MFGRGFVENNILANASGQPFVLGDLITHIGNFVSPDIAVWNTFFALIQLFIGVGLLFRRTVRPALAVSFFWVLGVWVIGEGLGMLLTGTATALTGAPGSVLLYGLLGLMAWPRPPRRWLGWSDRPAGIASSAAAQGIGRTITPLAVWAGYWSLAAVLFLLPANRTRTSIQSAIAGMADGVPGWYAHFLTSLANLFSTTGTQTAWILAAVSVAIGLGPLVARRPGWFLGRRRAALLLDVDRRPGPRGRRLQRLGHGPEHRAARDPAGRGHGAHRHCVEGGLAFARRRGPAAEPGGGPPRHRRPRCRAGPQRQLSRPGATESSSSAMSGMVMDGSSMSGSGSSSQSATVSTCVPHQTGLKISGLDLANTPYMVMSGSNGMDMNGADASAAAGFNTTTPNWHYTGPAIDQAEASALLADGNNGPSDIHMAESGCAPSLTAADDIGAVQYVQATSAAVSGYTTPAAAVAAGYVPASPTDYPVVTYVNPTIVAANAAAQRTLDPQHVDGLVYAMTPSGADVLAAAMYILPATETKVPMPYGALVQWHRRTEVCGPATPSPTMPFDITGYPPCAGGSTLQPTPYVSLVWQVPVAGGPLAIQPPDIQIVEAAVMHLSGTAVASQG